MFKQDIKARMRVCSLSIQTRKSSQNHPITIQIIPDLLHLFLKLHLPSVNACAVINKLCEMGRGLLHMKLSLFDILCEPKCGDGKRSKTAFHKVQIIRVSVRLRYVSSLILGFCRLSHVYIVYLIPII